MKVSKIEKRYKAKIPQNIIDFFSDETYKNYNNKITPTPSYEVFKIIFNLDIDLEDHLLDISSSPKQWIRKNPGHIPIAHIDFKDENAWEKWNAADGKEFFAVDTQSKKGAIYLHQEYGDPSKIAGSLEELLKMITAKPKEKYTLEEQVMAIDKAKDLYANQEHEKAVKKCQEIITRLNDKVTDSYWHRGDTYALWGNALMKLDQYEEALDIFDRMEYNEDYAILKKAEIYACYLNNISDALKLIETFSNDPKQLTKEQKQYNLPKVLGYCNLVENNIEKAKEQYKIVAESIKFNSGKKQEVLLQIAPLEQARDILMWFMDIPVDPNQNKKFKLLWKEYPEGFRQTIINSLDIDESFNNNHLSSVFSLQKIALITKEPDTITEIPDMTLFTHLKEIEIVVNNDLDIANLISLPSLEVLKLFVQEENSIKNIETLKQLKRVNELTIRGANARSIKRKMLPPNLQKINLSGGTTDVDFEHPGWKTIKHIKLYKPNISDTIAIHDLPLLESIEIVGCNANRLKVTNLPMLEDLILKRGLGVRQFTDDVVLDMLPELKNIELSGSWVQDISFLKTFQKLEIIQHAPRGLKTKITGILELKDLPNFKQYEGRRKHESKKIEEFEKQRPDVEIS